MILKTIVGFPQTLWGRVLSVCMRRHSSHSASFHNLNSVELDGSIREHNLHSAACDGLYATARCKQLGAGLPGLLVGSCFVYPNNGCFSRCVTAGPAGDRIKKSSALEENLDVIKLRDAQGCLTFIAVPILL